MMIPVPDYLLDSFIRHTMLLLERSAIGRSDTKTANAARLMRMEATKLLKLLKTHNRNKQSL